MPFAPFRHNVDSAEHARTFRVTDAGTNNVSVEAGRVRIDQTVTNFAAATALGPLANGTNFIYISNAAVITALLAGPYPANSIPLARVVVAAGDITGITDDRCFFYEDTAAGAGGNTLDQAYDQGGAGAGRTVIADSGRVRVTDDGIETTNLVVNKTTELIDGNDEIALPSTGWVYLSSAGAADNLLGIVAGTEGQRVWLTPTAGKDITLIHNSGATVAGQPLMINGEANVLLDEDHDMAIAVYDAVAAVWNVLVPGAGGFGDHDHTAPGDGGKLSGAIVDTNIILEDVDGTPVGDILLKVIDQWLRVRDAGDVGYEGIEVLEAVIGAPTAAGILLKSIAGSLLVRKGDDSAYGNMLANLFQMDAIDTLPGNDRLVMGGAGSLRRLFIPTSVGDPGVVANGDMWYEQITSKFRAREGGVSVDMIGGAAAGGVDPVALWWIDGVMGV